MPVRVKKTRHCEPLAVLIFLRDPDGNKVEAVCYRALCNVKLMIIEENESLIGRSNYIDEMLRIVGR